MKTTYVLKQSHISEFRASLLGEQPYLFGTSIRNFNFAFNEDLLNIDEIHLNVFKAIQTLNLNILKSTIAYPKTTSDIVSLVMELHLYEIDLDKLPRDTKLHEEIYSLVECAYKFVPKPTVPSGDIRVFEEGLTHSQLSYVTNNSLPLRSFVSIEPEMVRFRSALNIRSEIEACVQDILSNQFENVVVAIPNLQSHTSLVSSILARYNLPSVLESKRVLDAYLSVVEYILTPTMDRLKSMISFNPLNLQYPNELLTYLSITQLDHSGILHPFNHIKETPSFVDHFKLQERIQVDVQTLQTWIASIGTLTYFDALIKAYDTLLEFTRLPLLPLKQFLEAQGSLYDENTHAFFIEHIQKISSNQTLTGPIKWVDINDLPFGEIEYLYVLNLSAQNFPTISKRTGIIDATYLSSIETFPTIDKRTQFELENSNLIFKKSKNLTLSYAGANYEGKGFEVSFVVSSYCEEKDIRMVPWQLSELQTKKQVKHRLSPDIARRIYSRNGTLKGSISRFQNFIQDPYLFFIERGLGIHEPTDYTFNPMVMGTLNHSIVQHLNEPFDAWAEVSQVFPTDTPEYKLIRKRNDALMALNIEHINNALADTDFEIRNKELQFDEEHLFKDIQLRGIIDRIDTNDQYIMIIDYKSSSESLSEASVKAIKQLQLLTYAIIASKRFSLPILGVFNYAFRTSNILETYADYSLSKGLQLIENNIYNEWLRKKRLTGWFFEDPAQHIETEQYFTNLYISKTGLALRGGAYDFDKIETLMNHNYSIIKYLIFDGILDSTDFSIEIDEELSLKKDGETQ